MTLHAKQHYSVYIREGKIAEDEGDTEKAAEMYERAIKQEPLEEGPYYRLMVIYRKLKKYKDEYRVIEKALRLFTGHYKEKSERLFGANKKLEQAGKALLKSLTPKGVKESDHYPQPVPKWMKRKQTVEKKLGKKQK